ncbi:hypothetical protein L9F63_004905 [Diploptera punctata]|uniref:CHK kinase-like domain-containing protein n=1 Tax=Diploptera punctata TaxID=6984 RepID=A0AAD8E6R2_DIPPU|nr:hypothetical protein L9F63_004905 [Diploptera punctata]
MCSAPTWLNNQFLEEALNSKDENNVRVLTSEITRATAPGDNYGSDMYRAAISISKNGAQEKKSLIVKAELTSPEMRKIISEGNVFEREINAYNNIIPSLEQILAQSASNKYQPYAPKCYYTHLGEPASLIILEDLTESGFRLIKPLGGLDLKHCVIAIHALAVHHAASVVLHAEHPEVMEQFKVSGYSAHMRQNVERIFNPFLKQLADEAENWPECKSGIADKLHDLVSKTFDHLMTCVKTDDEVFNVFCHEDTWMNNIMFQYNEETKQVKDVRFVDFQVCQWTSPAVDLLYFINANASVTIVKRPHILIDEYYKTLSATLDTLGYGHLSPSKNDIYDEFEKRHKFGVIMGCILRKVMYVDRNVHDDVDMEKVLKEDFKHVFPEMYVKDMKDILPIFHQRGWL